MISRRYFGTDRPVLIFRSRCRPCRRLSRLARILSLGTVATFAEVSAEAQRFWADRPELRDQLTLISGSSITTGPAVFARIPAAVLRCVLPPLRLPFTRSRHH
ncbi:MAG TPA: hypothetical protein VEU30_00305 [Thermoanaerobaculia bacterium]|nr:hypothetical protein [Thermoanaerobaculia bacterium]